MAGDNAEVFEAIATKEFLLGDLTTPIKMKKLTDTTGSSENDTTSITHGLTSSKIIGIHVLITNSGGSLIPPGYTDVVGSEYYVYTSSTAVVIALHPTLSENILTAAITVLITYEAG